MYTIYCKLRDERKLKDADVSKATGISKSTFSDWKNGRSKPKLDKLQLIADYFHVSVGALIGVEKEDTEKIAIASESECESIINNRHMEILTTNSENQGIIKDTLYKNIIALCDERGIKGGRMCTDIGMSKGILTDLKMGRQTGISAVNAQKIASYFDVSVGYLLGQEEREDPADNTKLSEVKREIINFAKSLSEDEAVSMFRMMKTFDFVKTVPDDKAELVMKLIRTIVEND